MRRFALLLVPAVTVLAGCPIYDDDYYDECYYDAYGSYVCNGYPNNNGGSSSGTTPSRRCFDPADCFVGETCSAAGVCTSSSCSQVGCTSGYECVVQNGRATCVGQGSSSGGSSSGGPQQPECQIPADCPVAGSKCLNNECVTPEEQCTDGSQCNAGARCVDGVCTAQCATDTDCPIGYACDETRGLCTENPQPCSEQTPCPDGATCVGDRCVQDCTTDGECPRGLVCRLGGCVVDELPSFVCAVTGELGDGTAGKCATGSICLRGSCYIACDTAVPDSCRAADEFNVCKPVTTGGETYSVCGSEDNLGTECDAANGNPCADANDVCVDGYCL